VLLALVLFLAGGQAAFGAEKSSSGRLQSVEGPPPPPPLRSGEALEPDVTIVQDRRGRVEEYRVAGRLVAVKITPGGGAPPYFLVDIDGDGEFDFRNNELASDIQVNSWVLFHWR